MAHRSSRSISVNEWKHACWWQQSASLPEIWKKKNCNDWFERQSERPRFVVPLIYAFLGWFLYLLWLGIECATLAYQNNTLTNWATLPGLNHFLKGNFLLIFIVNSPYFLHSTLIKLTYLVPPFLFLPLLTVFCQCIIITYYGYNNPTYNAHTWVCICTETHYARQNMSDSSILKYH